MSPRIPATDLPVDAGHVCQITATTKCGSVVVFSIVVDDVQAPDYRITTAISADYVSNDSAMVA